MILGLDVGGTHTDTALVARGGVARTIKTPTESNLLETLTSALTRALEVIPLSELERMVFSTTLATNAVIQDRLHGVGMIVLAGPGIDPRSFAVGPCYRVIRGMVDHRGKEIVPPDRREVESVAGEMEALGLDHAGVTGKFSIRHPAHEQTVASWITNRFRYTALGHTVSGSLNFPRRIHTTYLNAALNGIHVHFVHSLKATLDRLGLKAPAYLLKPEGGTILMDRTFDRPAHTAQSGPAASIIGAMALHGGNRTSIILDIGGTTTDMGVLLDGKPLLNPRGVELGPYKTLIPSLQTLSIGIGGDSRVWITKSGTLEVGPDRLGPPAALRGPAPTPTDALVFLGILRIGNMRLAKDAMEQLARQMECDPGSIAELILRKMVDSISTAARQFMDEINSRPVYTISEVIEGRKVIPEEVIVIGGPAPYLARYLEEAFGLPVFVPPHFKVANAVGAACARVTTDLTLHADTQYGVAVIPEEGVEQRIDPRFSLEQARTMALEYLAKRAIREGAAHEEMSTSIVDEQMFNIVRDFNMVGRNIRLRAAVTPGLSLRWAQGGRNR